MNAHDLNNPIVQGFVLLSLILFISQTFSTILKIVHNKADKKERQAIKSEILDELKRTLRKIEALTLQASKNLEILTMHRAEDLKSEIQQNVMVSEKAMHSTAAIAAKVAEVHDEQEQMVQDRLDTMQVIGTDTNARVADIQEKVNEATPVILKTMDGHGKEAGK